MQKHPLFRLSTHYDYGNAHLAKDGALENIAGGRKHSVGTKHLSASLPFIADHKNGTSYAPWKAWSESTKKQTRFAPMPKKAAIRIYHKVVEWNRSSKLAGRHGGIVGSHVLLVLQAIEPKPRQSMEKRVQKSAPSRLGLKHIGGYFDLETVEKVALLRARLRLDNSELIKLAIDELHSSHLAKRAFGDA